VQEHFLEDYKSVTSVCAGMHDFVNNMFLPLARPYSQEGSFSHIKFRGYSSIHIFHSDM